MLRSLHHVLRQTFSRVNKTRGTTLIEMLIYMGIVSILLIGVGAVSMSALDARAKSRAVSAVYSGVSTAFGGIRTALEQNSVVWSPEFSNASSTLVLGASRASTSTTRIFIDNEQLQIVEPAGVVFPLTASDVRVSEVTFRGMGVGTTTSVAVTLVLSASSTSMWNSYQYTESFSSTYILGTYQ